MVLGAVSLGWGQADRLTDIHVKPRTQPDAALAAPSLPPLPPPLNSVDRSLRGARPFTKDVSLVLVPVTITDAWNRLVLGLKRDSFTVWEDGQTQVIRHFSSEDSPISLCIIFDVSKSMRNKIDPAREAVAEFIANSSPEDEFCLISFSDRPHFLVGFNDPVDSILGKLADVIPDGRTAMLDAVYMGMDELRHARNPRKVLLILSDGADNRSRYTAREIAERVMESDVQVYSIGVFEGLYLFTSPENARGPRLLSRIAEASGGSALTLTGTKELEEAARKINLLMRNQYVLGYRPGNPAHDGKWRKIKVSLSLPERSELHVTSKAGYYAPTQ
jgi:Ca-activated chloride channel family protein